MKISRLIALAIIALLVVGVLGLVSFKVFAQASNRTTLLQPAGEGPDDDGSEDADEANDIEAADGAEGDGEAGEADEAAEANEPDEADETAPAQTAITAEQAQAVALSANPGAAALAVEYDREGGVALWEVELDNGLDVKVDANSGAILGTEVRDEQ